MNLHLWAFAYEASINPLGYSGIWYFVSLFHTQNHSNNRKNPLNTLCSLYNLNSTEEHVGSHSPIMLSWFLFSTDSYRNWNSKSNGQNNFISRNINSLKGKYQIENVPNGIKSHMHNKYYLITHMSTKDWFQSRKSIPNSDKTW